MRWKGMRQSSNVEDRRGGGGKIIGGGIGVIIIAAIVYFMGGDPTEVLQQAGAVTEQSSSQPYEGTAAEEEAKQFVGAVLASTEDVWTAKFKEMGDQYQEPTLVLFSGSVQGGCGSASSATGPFYCPADNKLYIDLSFYNELKNRFNAPGDFAMAYVVAHEVGHHIQNLLGISGDVQKMRGRISQADYNRLSVKLELQADFLAGVWAHYADNMQGVVEEGDIYEALNAANAIGDDRLQKQAQGYVVPDAFTHGTSEQRMYWFKKGYESGNIKDGDTFSDPSL